jgi:hypothetical protein
MASWFRQVAEAMVDGTSLRVALELNGIALDAAQMRALYRNTEFRRMYGSAQEFVETRILGGLSKNDEFRLCDRQALSLEQ